MRIIPLAMLAFVTFALGFGELMIAAVLPPIAGALHVTIALTGQLVTAYALTFALLSPPLAVALRRVSAGPALAASLAVVTAANAVAGLAPTFGWLLAARVAAAAGSAVATPLALGAIDRVAGVSDRGRAHGIVFSGFSLAATLGVPLGALIAASSSWRWTFASVAILAALAAAGAAATLPPNPPSSAAGPAGLAATLGDPPIRRALLVSTLFLTAQYTAFTYFRPYFADVGGAPIDEIVRLFALYGAFGIAGTLLGGLAVDRWGTGPTIGVGVGGCALTLAALPIVVRSPAGAGAAVAVWALTSWGFAPAVNHELDRAAGTARDVALALNMTAFNTGIAAGSVLGGAVIVTVGIARLPLAAAALCAFALAAARDPSRRTAPER